MLCWQWALPARTASCADSQAIATVCQTLKAGSEKDAECQKKHLDMASLDKEQIFYFIALIVHHSLGRVHLLGQHHSQALYHTCWQPLKDWHLQATWNTLAFKTIDVSSHNRATSILFRPMAFLWINVWSSVCADCSHTFFSQPQFASSCNVCHDTSLTSRPNLLQHKTGLELRVSEVSEYYTATC